MLKYVFFILIFFFGASLFAQVDTAKDWDFTGENKLTFGTLAFNNWSAGGKDAISGLVSIDYKLNYSKDKVDWDNRLILAFGVNAQDKEGLEKTDDRIDFTTVYSYQIKDSRWFFSGLVNFKTQFSYGYTDVTKKDTVYNDNGKPFLDPDGKPYMKDSKNKIVGSRFMAPAYLTISPGISYKKDDLIKVSLSPLASKFTFVLDEELSNKGLFGVEKGKKLFKEFGMSVDAYSKIALSNRVNMENNLRLYSNYLHDFGNVDVDWVFKLNYKIGKLFTVDLSLHSIYDDDVKIDREEEGITVSGPVLQIKSTITIGLVYVID